MPRVQWPLLRQRPVIKATLTDVQNGFEVERNLLADTGAGNLRAGFELLLVEQDCIMSGASRLPDVVLRGAYSGSYRAYLVRVKIPMLGFDKQVPVVAVPVMPFGFEGIACFPFINRFTYGNFADPGQFGLEL